MPNMHDLPEDRNANIGTVCSNFDHIIDLFRVLELKETLTHGEYFAHSWFGQVWFEDGAYYCKVWRHYHHVETLSAPTFEELKDDLCDKYGAS